MKHIKKKSPIVNQIIPRRAGDSVQEYLEKTTEDAFDFFVIALFGVMLAFMEWLGFLFNFPRRPWVVTILALILVCYAIFRYREFRQKSQRIVQGRDGEKWVGNLLEGMRSKGWIPVHDVPCEHNGKKFNVDHILVGPKGIFIVETKTWSKKTRGENVISYKDGTLSRNGLHDDFGVLVQVKRSAKFAEEILHQRSGRNDGVSPILTFPCWKIEHDATTRIKVEHGVYLLSSKAILTYFDKSPDILESGDIEKIAYVFTAYAHEQAMNQNL